MSSIAIPAIGTGKVGLNIVNVGREMIRVAMNFGLTNPIANRIKSIYFIVLKEDFSSRAAFKLALRNARSELSIINSVTKSKSMETQPDKQKLISLYSTRYYVDDQQPFAINVYYGNILHSETDGILDLTEICQSHLDGNSNTLEFNSPTFGFSHSLSSELYEIQTSGQDPVLIKCCPYGMIARFDKELKSINNANIRSIAIPLLGSESTKYDISTLLDKIFEFVVHHGNVTRNLQRIDFVINHWHRCLEMTTWVRHQITGFQLDLHLPGKWITMQDFPYQPLGIDIAIATNDIIVSVNIEKIKKTMKKLMPSLVSRTLSDVENLCNLDESQWLDLKMSIWNQYSTILTKNASGEHPYFTIYGLSEDVINATIELNRHAKRYYTEKAKNDLHEFTCKAAPWQAKIGRSYYPFDVKLNYEIEKHYQLYQQGKAALQNVSLDGGTKSVNYTDMVISLLNHDSYQIKKVHPGRF